MADAFAVDSKIVQELVEQAVRENILSTLENMVQDSNWLTRVESMINQTAAEKTLNRLSRLDIDKIVGDQVRKNFTSDAIQQQVTNGVQVDIAVAISTITQDPAWLARIEQTINQAVVYQTISKISSIDINTVIQDRVDENIDRFLEKLRAEFASTGINDQATRNQMTVMDEATVFENNLVANNLTIASGATIQNLAVTGSINTDNHSWNILADNIAEKAWAKITDDWQNDLVRQVADHIKTNGIEFERVSIGGELLVDGDRLGKIIRETSIETTGVLRSLQVAGAAHLNDTFTVVKKRVGINTQEPEMALSVWDEEVALIFGKHKLKEAYIGTSRVQALTLGVNRVGQLTIDADGLTTIKKLQVGLHKISHATQVPGWSGTRGDMVFNASPGSDRVFAWVCLGAYKWQVLKSAE